MDLNTAQESDPWDPGLYVPDLLDWGFFGPIHVAIIDKKGLQGLYIHTVQTILWTDIHIKY